MRFGWRTVSVELPVLSTSVHVRTLHEANFDVVVEIGVLLVSF